MYSVIHLADLPNGVADEILELARGEDVFGDFDDFLEAEELPAYEQLGNDEPDSETDIVLATEFTESTADAKRLLQVA